MLDKAGPEAARPDGLDEQFGLHDGKYYLSPEQARDILELRLHRLTGMEHEKIIDEFALKLEEIADYQDILADISRLMSVIRQELEEVVEELSLIHI